MPTIRAVVFKLSSAAIFLLWPTYIGIAGTDLFAHLNRTNHEELVVPFSTGTLILACIAFINFIVFRTVAGSFNCRGDYPVTTRQSKLAYAAAAMTTLLVLLVTTLNFSLLSHINRPDYLPPVSVVYVIILIVMFVAILGGEQFASGTFFVVTTENWNPTAEERLNLTHKWSSHAAGVYVIYEEIRAPPSNVALASVQPKLNSRNHAE